MQKYTAAAVLKDSNIGQAHPNFGEADYELEKDGCYESEFLGGCYPRVFHEYRVMPETVLSEETAQDYTGDAEYLV